MSDPAIPSRAAARAFPDGVPILVDPAGDITLRPASEEDLPAIVEQSRDAETIRWTLSVPNPPGGYSVNDARDFLAMVASGWEEGSRLNWTVEAVRDGVRQHCGLVHLRLEEPGWAEIGFGLHPRARGRGLMSGAVRLVRDYGFDVIGLSTLRWRAKAGNWPSRWVAAATGFIFDGAVRRLLVQRGTLVDGWVATMTSDDPRTPRRGLVSVELLGAGIVLRPFRESDAERIVEACSDARTRHWLVSLPRPYEHAHALSYVEYTRELLARGAGLVWCIADADDDRCVGSIGLEGLGSYAPRAEIGYWAHPQARGRGLVTEAVRLVSGYVQSAGLATSIVIRSAVDNTASRHVAEGAGYREVGRLPEAEPVGDGRLSELVLYARP
ncbi:MAG TPA: GNAT family N-acetyltransferase [Propionibacteriaceae bacterium]|nr:GNAT family N-acetyltransferase [Propionibacteriaceae bacterium]